MLPSVKEPEHHVPKGAPQSSRIEVLNVTTDNNAEAAKAPTRPY
jgi:hypothetical protein